MAHIDIEGMTRLVRSMEDIGEALLGIRHEYQRTLRRFDASDREAAGLAGPQQWVVQELPGLRRRLVAAQRIEAARPSWQSGLVTIKERELSTMDAAAARTAGAETALALLKDTRSPDDETVRMLMEMSTDPYFAAGFAAALSPEQLATLVKGWSGARDEAVIDDQAAQTRYAELVAALSSTIATATFGTGDVAPPPGYAKAWVAALTAAPHTDPGWDGGPMAEPDQAAALGILLGGGGVFAPDFIGTLAEEVLVYEQQYLRAHGRTPWLRRTAAQLTGASSADVRDPHSGAGRADPLVGILTALAQTPEQAVEFLDPDHGGPVSLARMEYLIGERTWKQDSYGAIGQVLAAAGTAWHSGQAPVDQQERSAWITSAGVHLLAGQQVGRLGPQGAAAIGDLLASYISDVDRVVKTWHVDDAQLAVSSTTLPATTAGLAHAHWWMSGMPVGAEFDRDELAHLLRKTLVHDKPAVTLAEAASAFNTSRIAGAAEAFEADEAVSVHGAVGSSARLVGYLTGAVEAATVAEATAKQQRRDTFVSIATTAVGVIPASDAAIKFLDAQQKAMAAERALSALEKNGIKYVVGQSTSKLIDAVAPHGADVAAVQATADHAAYLAEGQLRLAAARAVATSRHIPQAARYDSEGELLPWLQPGVNVERVLSDPVVVRHYLVPWSMEGSGFVTSLTSEVGTAFDDGRDLGMGK